MIDFLYGWLYVAVCVLGPFLLCGLVAEACYRLLIGLMGQAAGRFLWRVTSCIGTPLHELGHAMMCLIFAHRIERVRLLPSKHEDAMVEHSYNKKNPYAAFGCLWIGLGPLILGLGVGFLLLLWAFPDTVRAYWQTVSADSAQLWDVWTVLRLLGTFASGLITENSRALWVRLLAVGALVCLALHVRLSVSDVKSMLVGMPTYAALCAIVALIACLEGKVLKLCAVSQRIATVLCCLFALLLSAVIILVALSLVWRLLSLAWRAVKPSK